MEPDGWTVCREIRKISSVPIIILTKRMDDFDEIYGLELGADDYIKKPANSNILLARIHSLLRRSYHDSDSLIYYKHLTIDNARHSVHIQNQEIVLSPKEYRI